MESLQWPFWNGKEAAHGAALLWIFICVLVGGGLYNTTVFMIAGRDMRKRVYAVEAYNLIVRYLEKVGLLETEEWDKGDQLAYVVGNFRNGAFTDKQLCDFIMGHKSIDQIQQESEDAMEAHWK